jgi:hypothetical protein
MKEGGKDSGATDVCLLLSHSRPVGLLPSLYWLKKANSAVLAAGLSQASGSAAGIIQSTGADFGRFIVGL